MPSPRSGHDWEDFLRSAWDTGQPRDFISLRPTAQGCAGLVFYDYGV